MTHTIFPCMVYPPHHHYTIIPAINNTLVLKGLVSIQPQSFMVFVPARKPKAVKKLQPVPPSYPSQTKPRRVEEGEGRELLGLFFPSP